MRLLQLKDGGDFSLVEYIGREIPQYAILSHTWGFDHEEVSFRDLLDGTGRSKAGYRKLTFCAKQAAQDDIQFFWVDTCSIDKSSSSELSEAINSMFQWYSRAKKCYVYLSDVSKSAQVQGVQPSHHEWISYFRRSRWFTRGWTLQELIAPKEVEFFSTEGELLGTKISLMEEICNITGLSSKALNGTPLSQFSVSDRMSWAEKRETRREEDAVYSLLGIFDTHMPLLYGEGREKAFTRLFREIESSRPKPLPSTTVPFRRDDDFINSESLDKIRQICARPASRAALIGLGGVGKSQIAIEYAYQVRDASPSTWVFWVHAGTRARFEEGYRRIAEATKLDGWNNPKADILRLVRSWLSDESNGRWLIVLDNADDSGVFFENTASPGQPAELLSDFLPQSLNGSLLITSRSQPTAYKLIGTFSSIIEVKPMDKDNALTLLKKKLDVIADENDAIKLIHILDAMPLALTQAAAFIKQRAPRMTVQRYLDEFSRSDDNRARLLNVDVGDTRRDGQASNSILATWQISFEHIKTCEPNAAHLLSLMSLFDRQGIPESLLRKQYGDVVGDSFDDDIHTLISYSLVETSADTHDFEMHRLVQFSTKKWLELQDDMEIWKEKYVTLIDNSYPEAQYENWKVCQMLLPHAQAAIACRPNHSNALEAWASILHKVAWYAGEMGHFQTAQELNQDALETRKVLLGAEHPDTIHSMANLATTFWNQGKWKKSEALELQVVEMSKRLLGEDHEDTLTSMDNLAATFWDQGRLKEAEELELQVIESRKQAFGERHPETLASISKLAAMYSSQARWKEIEELEGQVIESRKQVSGERHAEPLISTSKPAEMYSSQARWKEVEELEGQVIESKKRGFGEEHPDTLRSINILASAYLNQGRWSDAEELHVQAVETTKKMFGEEHPNTLSSISTLASTYWNQGRWKEAEKLISQVREARERVLGEEHPSTLLSIAGLAAVYGKQGRWKEAEELEVYVTNMEKRVLGAEHPETLTSMNNLAATYRDQGRWKEAKDLNIQTIQIRKRVLGAEHPSTLFSINSLVSTLRQQGSWTEAEELGLQVIKTRKRVLGVEHPDTLNSIHTLASIYGEQERWMEAEELEVQAAKTRTSVLGEEHPDTLDSMANLAWMYRNQKRYKEAEELGFQVMEKRKTLLGEEHPDTLTSIASLASTYWNQGRWKESEELGSKIMETRKRTLGNEHPDTLRSMADLAHVYMSQSRHDEAMLLMEKCLQLRRQILGLHHPDTESSLVALKTWQREDIEMCS